VPTGVELATAWIRIVPSVEGIQGAVSKELDASGVASTAGASAGTGFVGGVKGKLGGLAGVIGGAFIASKVTDFFGDSISAVSNWQSLNAQTQAVVKSTGGAAGVTAGQVNDLATSLEGQTAVQAESIQSGANMLLTFKNLKNGVGEGNQVFDDATKTLVDMSTAMGTDPQSAAIQLGKALNDPVAGISALSRVGVTFTDDQKALIQTLVDSGDTMGAQKVILAELNGEFGGSGAAQADTYAGKLFLLQDSFGDMGEAIVSAVVPALSDLFSAVTPVFNFLADNQGILIALATVLGVVLATAFYLWAASVWAANVALLANPTTWIVLGIMALIAIIVLLVMNWDAVVKFITDIWNGFISWFTGVMDGFFGWWNGVWAGFASWIGGVWQGFVGFISDVWNGFISWIMGILNAYVSFWMSIWEGVAGFVSDIWNGIVGFVSDAVNNVAGVIGDVFGTVGDIIKGAFSGVVDFVRGIFNSIIGLVNGVIDGINSATSIAAAVGINIGRIGHLPMLANGGTITSAGSVIVGERGPELLRLPRGASVDPNIAGAGNGAPLIGGDVIINTTQSASRAFVQELREQSFVLGM